MNTNILYMNLSRVVATLIVSLMLCCLVGCRKSYSTVVSTDESISKNAPATIDGNPAGRVSAVQRDDQNQLIAHFTIERPFEAKMREGVVRVRKNGTIDLRTSNVEANARPISEGAIVPVENEFQHNLRNYTRNGRTVALILLATGVLVALVVFAGRAFKSVLLFAAIVALAIGTAWIAHPILISPVQKVYEAVSGFDSPNQTSNATPAPSTSGRQARVHSLLTTLPDSRIVAFALCFLISACAFALGFAIFRRAFTRIWSPSTTCLLFGLATLGATTALADSAGVSYSRERLLKDQETSRQFLTEAQRHCDTAERHLDADLRPETAEELALASFEVDRTDCALEGHVNRIDALKTAPLSYLREDEKRKLAASYAGVSQQVRDVQSRITALQKRCGTTNSTALQVYLVKREDFRARIRRGLNDGNLILLELRQLAAFPISLIRAGIVSNQNVSQCRLNPDGSVSLPTGETVLPDGRVKTAADLEQVKREQSELQRQLAQLRRENTNRALPQTIVVTNEIRTIVEKLVPAPAPPPEIRYVTNSVLVAMTNRTDAVSATSTGSVAQVAVRKGPTNVTSVAWGAASEKPTKPETDSERNSETLLTNVHAENVRPPHAEHSKLPFRVNKMLLYVGAALVIAVLTRAASAMMSGRARSLQLAESGKPLNPFTITSADDVLVLTAEPRVEHRSQTDGKASIRPTWRGSILHPGSESVSINGETIQKPKRLTPGDRVTAATGEADSRTFDFLGCDQVNEAVEA